jgi:hypothetical protein
VLRHDTLVLAGGRWWNETVNFAENVVACAVHAIQGLGLSVSPAKSEALWFFYHRRRGTPPSGLSVAINGEQVPVGCQMKYLGLTIDSQWSFEPHFALLVQRVTTAANALCGLMPNVGGAGVSVRRLYEGVVRSRILYGAPVWAEDLMASHRSLVLLRRLQRTTAIRTARGYRRVYKHLRDLRLERLATTPPPDGRSAPDVREEAKLDT